MSFNLQGTVNKIRRKGGQRGHDALTPIYELLVNSINAERNNSSKDKDIIININYTTSTISVNEKQIEIINKIKITDRGIGFNKEQINSFKSINSTTNQALGCRGSGKFEILRAFHKIKVQSFNNEGIIELELCEKNYNNNNIEGFSKETYKYSSLDITTVECIYDEELQNVGFDEVKYIKSVDLENLKDRIQSKLLLKLALLSKEGYNINIKLQDCDFLQNKDLIGLDSNSEIFKVNGLEDEFTIYHLRTDKITPKANESRNCILWVSDNIEVKKGVDFFQDKPKSLFKDNNLRYIAIIQSRYLDKFAFDDRTDFDIEGNIWDSIKREVQNKISNHLQSELKDYYDEKANRISNVKKKYPFLKEIDIEFKPDDTEEQIAEKGYIQSATNELKSVNEFEVKIKEFSNMLKEKDYGENMTKNDLFAEQDREQKLKKKAHEIADAIPNVKKHILSRTVSEEYAILKQIEECIEQKGAEHYIHDIVFPRFNIETKERGIEISDKASDNAKKAYDKANLWLIDDKYIGYNYQYLASEFQIKDFDERMLQASDIKEKYKESRPDICVFQENDNGNIEPVVVIEFKAQSSNKKVSEAAEQTKDYAKIISSISNNKYSRFTLLIIQPIEEIKSATDYLNSEDWATLKQEHHYIKTYTIKDYNKNEISIASEVISLKRFAELARKRKERYMKDLGLI